MEINIKLNGEKRVLDQPVNVAALILMSKLSAENLIAELNRELLHKNKYEETILKNGDELELIRFVGGG